MRLSSCISWDPTLFDAVPLRDDFVAGCRKSAAIGFDAVELAIRDPAQADTKLILQTLAEYNLSLSAIGTGGAWVEDGLSFTDEDSQARAAAIRRVISHFPLAQKTGAAVIIGLVRGVRPPEYSEVTTEQASAWMYEAFAQCCEQAAERKVKIAVEPINRYETGFINTVQDGLDLIQKIGADDTLGLLIDTFHMNIEEPIIADSIKMAGSHVFHVHYADSNRLHPGRGHIDFQSVIDSLKSIGYDGYLSGEHAPDPDPETAISRAHAYMSAYL